MSEVRRAWFGSTRDCARELRGRGAPLKLTGCNGQYTYGSICSMSVKHWISGMLPLPWRSAGRYWYRRAAGTLDPGMSVIRPLMRPGTTAVDAGAHYGVYTYFFTRSGLHVEAFEPVPECQNVLAAMRGDVTLHRTALSDVAGTRELVVPLQHGAPETQLAHLGPRPSEAIGRRLPVSVSTLDSFAFRDVSMIKIDVEGHELAVLRGAAETIERDRPILYIEIEVRHAGTDRVLETFKWLSARGYSAFFLRPNGTLAPGAEFDLAKHQAYAPEGAVNTGYVNNFLFAHRSNDAALRHFHARTSPRPA